MVVFSYFLAPWELMTQILLQKFVGTFCKPHFKALCISRCKGHAWILKIVVRDILNKCCMTKSSVCSLWCKVSLDLDEIFDEVYYLSYLSLTSTVSSFLLSACWSEPQLFNFEKVTLLCTATALIISMVENFSCVMEYICISFVQKSWLNGISLEVVDPPSLPLFLRDETAFFQEKWLHLVYFWKQCGKLCWKSCWECWNRWLFSVIYISQKTWLTFILPFSSSEPLKATPPYRHLAIWDANL